MRGDYNPFKDPIFLFGLLLVAVDYHKPNWLGDSHRHGASAMLSVLGGFIALGAICRAFYIRGRENEQPQARAAGLGAQWRGTGTAQPRTPNIAGN